MRCSIIDNSIIFNNQDLFMLFSLCGYIKSSWSKYPRLPGWAEFIL